MLTQSKIFLMIQILAICELSSVSATTLKLPQLIENVEKNLPILNGLRQELLQAKGDLLKSEGGFDSTVKSKISAKPSFGKAYSFPEKIGFESESTLPLEWGGVDLKGRYRFGQADENWGEYGSLTAAAPGQIELGLSIPLMRGRGIDKRRTQKNQAEVKLSQVEKQIESQTNQIYENAILTWSEAVSAKLRYKIQNDLLDLAKVRDQALLLRLRHGDIPAVERIDNQRSVQKRIASVKKSNRDLQDAILELSLYWRNEGGLPTIPKVDELPDSIDLTFNWNKNSEELSEIALKNRPDFAALQKQIDSLKLEVAFVQNSMLPKLNFDLWTFNTLGSTEKIQGFVSPNAGILGSIVYELPIQNRVNVGMLGSTTAQMRRLELMQKWLKEKIAVENRESIINLGITKERIDQLILEIELSKKVEEAERLKFINGDSNLLMIYIREENTADASLRLVEAKQEFVKYCASYLKNQGLSPSLLAQYF